MASLLVAHHRPGFYLPVITEGRVRARDPITRTRPGKGSLTVADTDALLYLPDPDPAKPRAALTIEALSPGWQGSFQEMSRRLDRPPGPAPAAPGWTGFRQLRVTQVVPETPTVSSFHLQAADSQVLPPAEPGQYLTVRIPRDGRPGLVRSYSL